MNMLCNQLLKTSAKAIPIGVAVLNVGLLFLIVGIVWPHAISACVSPQWNDFARGVFYGIAIAFETIAVVILATACAAKLAARQ
jgi:hypothetical protein